MIADILMSHGQIVRVINTHLQDVVSKESATVHMSQTRLLRHVIAHSPYPVILLGDLNTEPGSKNYKHIFQAGLTDSHGNHPQHTFLKINPISIARGVASASKETDRCLDYVASELPFDFMESGIGAYAQVLKNPHSDHLLVLAKILLQEELHVSGVRRIRPPDDILIEMMRAA